MLGDVQETVYLVDDDDEAGENVRVWQMSQAPYFCGSWTDTPQTVYKKSEMLFVRGMPEILLRSSFRLQC